MKQTTTYLLLICLVSAMGGLLFGYDWVVIGGAKIFYEPFFGLEGSAQTLASNLPYGKQRKLEIARALATKPELLLLDEPAAGMNPNETGELMDTIRLVRKEYQVTILLIEHDMKLVQGICEYLYVLNFGRLLAEGTPDKVLNDPAVVKAYLGD